MRLCPAAKKGLACVRLHGASSTGYFSLESFVAFINEPIWLSLIDWPGTHQDGGALCPHRDLW